MALDLMDDEELTAARADELEAQESQGLPPTMSTNPLQMGPGGSVITGNPTIPYGESRPQVPTAPGDAWWIEKPSQVDNRIDYDARNRQESVREMLRAASFKDANKAIEQAMRLEGMLGFDADRKAGIPVMEALQKWGSKISYNSPSGLASIMRTAGADDGAPFTPSSTTVDGQKMFQMSPHRFAFPPGGDEFTPGKVNVDGIDMLRTGPRSYREIKPPVDKDAAMAKRVQYDNIKGQIKALERAAAEPQSKAKRQELQTQIDGLRSRAEKIYVPKTASPDSMQAHREEAAQLIQKYPAKADAIRKRFRETYDSDL